AVIRHVSRRGSGAVIGTAINVATVVAGSVAGKAAGDRLPSRMRETVMHVIALVTLLIGAQMSLKSQNPVVLLCSLILGGLTGEALRIEAAIERAGAFAERRLGARKQPGDHGGDFARGFVTTSILFCVGPMTILGCLNDGL